MNNIDVNQTQIRHEIHILVHILVHISILYKRYWYVYDVYDVYVGNCCKLVVVILWYSGGGVRKNRNKTVK